MMNQVNNLNVHIYKFELTFVPSVIPLSIFGHNVHNHAM